MLKSIATSKDDDGIVAKQQKECISMRRRKKAMKRNVSKRMVSELERTQVFDKFASAIGVPADNVKDFSQWMPVVTGETPLKNVEKTYEEEEDNGNEFVSPSADRRKKCTGNPFPLVNCKETKHFSCQICRKNGVNQRAQVYCIECKGFFCFFNEGKRGSDSQYCAFHTGYDIPNKEQEL